MKRTQEEWNVLGYYAPFSAIIKYNSWEDKTTLISGADVRYDPRLAKWLMAVREGLIEW